MTDNALDKSIVIFKEHQQKILKDINAAKTTGMA